MWFFLYFSFLKTCTIRFCDYTQTKKSRFNRWENVADIFGIATPELINNKHILLVDDVVTTGATIEACAKILREYHAKVSVVSIACA